VTNCDLYTPVENDETYHSPIYNKVPTQDNMYEGQTMIMIHKCCYELENCKYKNAHVYVKVSDALYFT